MPTLQWFPYEKRFKYPHMMPGDVAIWERYIDTRPLAFDKVAYDVVVGDGAKFDPTVNDETGGDANRLYQRKIDVVAVQGVRVYIIEIKPAASTGAIGQVKGYTTLLKRDYEPEGIIVPMILTDLELPEMKFLASNEGVELVIV